MVSNIIHANEAATFFQRVVILSIIKMPRKTNQIAITVTEPIASLYRF